MAGGEHSNMQCDFPSYNGWGAMETVCAALYPNMDLSSFSSSEYESAQETILSPGAMDDSATWGSASAPPMEEEEVEEIVVKRNCTSAALQKWRCSVVAISACNRIKRMFRVTLESIKPVEKEKIQQAAANIASLFAAGPPPDQPPPPLRNETVLAGFRFARLSILEDGRLTCVFESVAPVQDVMQVVDQICALCPAENGPPDSLGDWMEQDQGPGEQLDWGAPVTGPSQGLLPDNNSAWDVMSTTTSQEWQRPEPIVNGAEELNHPASFGLNELFETGMQSGQTNYQAETPQSAMHYAVPDQNSEPRHQDETISKDPAIAPLKSVLRRLGAGQPCHEWTTMTSELNKELEATMQKVDGVSIRFKLQQIRTEVNNTSKKSKTKFEKMINVITEIHEFLGKMGNILKQTKDGQCVMDIWKNIVKRVYILQKLADQTQQHFATKLERFESDLRIREMDVDKCIQTRADLISVHLEKFLGNQGTKFMSVAKILEIFGPINFL